MFIHVVPISDYLVSSSAAAFRAQFSTEHGFGEVGRFKATWLVGFRLGECKLRNDVNREIYWGRP